MKQDESVLVIDIGNTSASVGLFRNGRVSSISRIEKIDQDKITVQAVIRTVITGKKIHGAAIASVVPGLNKLWDASVRKELGTAPLWINHKVNLGIPVTYPKPETIGADRLANAVGGVRVHGAPLIIADFGTAVTFDLVTKKQGYVGGIIAPGLPLMFDYLADRTAKLPRITWSPVRGRIGKCTADAMQLGAHWGYRGMVREILAELMQHPSLRNARVCATGGYAARVLKDFRPVPIIDNSLTLFGVGCIHELNR